MALRKSWLPHVAVWHWHHCQSNYSSITRRTAGPNEYKYEHQPCEGPRKQKLVTGQFSHICFSPDRGFQPWEAFLSNLYSKSYCSSTIVSRKTTISFLPCSTKPSGSPIRCIYLHSSVSVATCRLRPTWTANRCAAVRMGTQYLA